MALSPTPPGVGINPLVMDGGAAPAWTPASLPDLELWLPNSFLATIGDAQPIAQWDDASGLARHAVQATAANRPTARLTVDKWEAKGDGVDDWLRSTFGATVAQPTTVWCVVSIPVSVKFGWDGIVSGSRQFFWRSSSTDLTYAASTGVSYAAGAGAATLHYVVAIFSGASSSLRIDGAQVATGNPGTESLTGLTLFANITPGAFSAGVIRDTGLCSSVLAGADLTNLETYLAGLV